MTRELDGRISDGIHVRLLWDASDDRVLVAVNDTKTGDAFELPVRDGDRALDVFHHPYAYARDANGDAVAAYGRGGRVRARTQRGAVAVAPRAVCREKPHCGGDEFVVGRLSYRRIRIREK
jgi:hypothetical protein